MALYELRTYDVQVGKMADVIKAYSELGWPALDNYKDKLVGYFTSDTGTVSQLVHLWKFNDDADRRNHWKTLFADEDFMAFAKVLRPNLLSQRNQLLLAAPWGPHP